jgi:hypothetical protein
MITSDSFTYLNARNHECDVINVWQQESSHSGPISHMLNDSFYWFSTTLIHKTAWIVYRPFDISYMFLKKIFLLNKWLCILHYDLMTKMTVTPQTQLPATIQKKAQHDFKGVSHSCWLIGMSKLGSWCTYKPWLPLLVLLILLILLILMLISLLLPLLLLQLLPQLLPKASIFNFILQFLKWHLKKQKMEKYEFFPECPSKY